MCTGDGAIWSAPGKTCDVKGLFFINYDAGHFVQPTWRDRTKNVIGPVLARAGIERYYQSFVRESDFRSMAIASGFTIAEARSFNTAVKQIASEIPADEQTAFQRRWLEFEESISALYGTYDDTMALTFQTRTSCSSRADAPTPCPSSPEDWTPARIGPGPACGHSTRWAF